jgi:hypothetical protein
MAKQYLSKNFIYQMLSLCDLIWSTHDLYLPSWTIGVCISIASNLNLGSSRLSLKILNSLTLFTNYNTNPAIWNINFFAPALKAIRNWDR